MASTSQRSLGASCISEVIVFQQFCDLPLFPTGSMYGIYGIYITYIHLHSPYKTKQHCGGNMQNTWIREHGAIVEFRGMIGDQGASSERRDLSPFAMPVQVRFAWPIGWWEVSCLQDVFEQLR